MNKGFYNGKKVFLTGHTGFKGAWMCRVLTLLGADVTGYALDAPTNPSFFELCGIKNDINSVFGDIRDINALKKAFDACAPEIVIHMAAQPLVIDSYKMPRYTYETNVMGTVNILECVKNSGSVRSLLNVTTDKVYKNEPPEHACREDEKLDGYDPYSNSKSCSELVTHSYERSFLKEKEIAVSTARSGNVIGGGDFAENRIIPDCVRAAEKKSEIIIRNPHSVRPYQHVLEALNAYLIIAQQQYLNIKNSGCYNVGPDKNDCVSTGALAEIFCDAWGDGMKWKDVSTDGPHEAGFLMLDNSKIKEKFGWKPTWNIKSAVENTVNWSKLYCKKADTAELVDETDREIKQFGICK